MDLQIRKMKPEDFEPLHALLSNADVMRFLEPPFSEEQTKKFLKTQGLTDALISFLIFPHIGC